MTAAAILTLGNLTIISQALNASIHDSDWAIKKAGRGDKGGMKKYAERIETFFAYLYADVWDEKEIQDRASYLSSKALEAWAFCTISGEIGKWAGKCL